MAPSYTKVTTRIDAAMMQTTTFAHSIGALNVLGLDLVCHPIQLHTKACDILVPDMTLLLL